MSESQADKSVHVPVMLEETLEHLDLRPSLTYVDATAGGGGHLCAMEKRLNGEGIFVGIDRDKESLDRLNEKVGKNTTLIHSNFSQIKEALEENGINTVSGGILADLGLSSIQLDNADRGFSFMRDGPLDMRMNRGQRLTASDIVNGISQDDLANIIYKYGEEKKSRWIARKIVAARPITSTTQLAQLVASCVRGDNQHPATRTFQAIRMAVNEELESLELFLKDSLNMLAPGARLVLITFHSLEDRLVKQFFKRSAQDCVCPPRQPVCNCHHERKLLIITKKPVKPTSEEVLANIRSRSAKLRAGQRVG